MTYFLRNQRDIIRQVARACYFLLLILTWGNIAKARVMREHEGRLINEAGIPVRGPVDLEISLYRQEAGGDPLLPAPLSFNQVALEGGNFRIRIELSDADSLIVFGARGNAKVWLQILDQTNDRVYPRQLMTGVSEVMTAITKPMEQPSETSKDREINTPSNAGVATETRISTQTANSTNTETAQMSDQINTQLSTETAANIMTNTTTAYETDSAGDIPPMATPTTVADATSITSLEDEPLLLELPRATFIESPLNNDATTARAELGTAGQCGSQPEIGGEVRFVTKFTRKPHVFLTPGDGESEFCVPRMIARDRQGFVWSSGSGLMFLGGCSCIQWMAVGP